MSFHPMKFDPAYNGNEFIGATQDYDKARAVLYGMPMDWTVSFRGGTRLGPARIREVSIGLEEYSPYLDMHMETISFFDAGDLPLPFGNPGKSVEVIEQYVAKVLADGKLPFGMGGEHLVTLGPVRAVSAKYPELAVIQLDAHADLREDYEGEPFSHAAVMRHICGLIGPRNVYQLGIRSGTREEFYWAKENTNFHPFEVLDPLARLLPALAGRPVYLTVDIDVVDPAFAPGTGTVEAGGISSADLLKAIHMIAASDVQVVGFDIVEVSPGIDPSEQTQILASKAIREALLGFTQG
ncbi:MAG: agmatinase [Bacilli bacterium]|nr:agmatinase [Bacilli bacterium]